MDIPPAPHAPEGAGAGASGVDPAAAREVAEARETRRATCASQAAEVRHVARIVKRCRAEVRERVLALGDGELDLDAEVFADKQAVDSVMCAFGIGKNEAARLVDLADRLTVLPEVWAAWTAGVLDGWRVRVLADPPEVLDDATARAVPPDGALVDGPAPRGRPGRRVPGRPRWQPGRSARLRDGSGCRLGVRSCPCFWDPAAAGAGAPGARPRARPECGHPVRGRAGRRRHRAAPRTGPAGRARAG
jgi:hypothetical protein